MPWYALVFRILYVMSYYTLGFMCFVTTHPQVANFHLRNGASVWRLNWLADPSARGMAASFGIRVNYRYDVQHLLANNRQYVVDGRAAVAPSVLHALGVVPCSESEQWVVQPSAD